MRRCASVAVFVVASLLLAGCGSSNTNTTSNTPTPTTTSTPPPSSGGSGGTSGGSGGSSGGSGGTTGGGSEQPRNWEESLLPIGSFGSGGTADVTVATAGYSLTLAGGTNDATYVAEFCPFAVQGCTTFADKPTFRNSGGMQFMGTFPGHGTFSGKFVITRNGADTWATGFSLPPNGSVAFGSGATPLSAQLVKASAVSAGLAAQSQFGIGSDTLTDGTLTVTQPDGTAHASVTGASPSTAYTISYCDPAGGNCVALGTLTTDASGNGSAAVSISPAVKSGDINSGQFKLSRNGASGPVEFVTGFIIP